MIQNADIIPTVTFRPAGTGATAKANELGMRPMQARAYDKRGEQYLLIKSPPASGKSRALMFIALDKLTNQGVKKAIVCVPERSIGASFNSEPLSKHGFWADWEVAPQWNLCNTPGADDPKVAKSKVKAVGEFLVSDARVLVCTHATFRFAFDEMGVEAFDTALIAIDEFHHVSADAGNRLGAQLAQLIGRDKAHIVAMTGSYFRGDAIPVLAPDDEAKFETVTYTYYEQLNGYQYLKVLDIGYSFYTGPYTEKISALLDPTIKTIVHIPSVNSRESLKDKHREAEDIMGHLGEWHGVDTETGFHLLKTASGATIKVADLVDDDASKRDRVVASLKSAAARSDRDFVDVIIALGMAKEGFDWIWCEHALTVGYRSSLTEIIQIIGRATRDAPGKTRARFTNLIAEPAADDPLVVDAINDYLKAIAASLLMEQVLAPRFEFTPKDAGPKPDFDYGPDGYQEGATNIGVNAQGQMHFEIKGLKLPTSIEATRICREDLNEVIASFVQDKSALERGMFDTEVVPEELTQLKMGKIIREKFPDLSEDDQEAVRQHAIAALTLTQQAKAAMVGDVVDGEFSGSTAFIDGVRKFALSVTDLDIDLIDRVNPFDATYAVLAKAMDEKTLLQVQAVINAKKDKLTYEDARMLAERALEFKRERGRLPSLTSQDAWERKMAEGIAFLQRHAAKAAADG
ncbi:YeeB-like protein [Novosphingobium nitrogenifigens DSM 19370]|uniref:YeeB-like protein n=1 Tax=Novosphingobium nitrogenifigens DSM 19370 TaxID=983920 RepID=F1Z4K4_9SPHN|nr:DEAD/DEAH box helicase [Novosphingobium nitrogenifigens]EGD60474.1 YeeB-like protein [Novosphingobium nitrogenifigens DSM 19370]